MKKVDYSTELDFAKKLALKAGKTMIQYFDGDQKVKLKKDNSAVTIADIEINEMVIKELLKKFPNDGIIGEERSISTYGMGRIWFCDPVDGTAAYTWGVPTSMFSLALVVDGIPMMGVAYDPFLKKMYFASKGNGSFCNNKKLNVSNISFDKGVLAVPGSIRRLSDLPYFKTLKDLPINLAVFSGAVYKTCLVAAGRFVGHIEPAVSAHDMAAVHVIIEEAGGKITGYDGEKLNYSTPFKGSIVSNKKVHKQLVDLVNNG